MLIALSLIVDGRLGSPFQDNIFICEECVLDCLTNIDVGRLLGYPAGIILMCLVQASGGFLQDVF